MPAINHRKKGLFLQTCTYLGQRLGFLLRHPQEVVGFVARAIAIYRSQGWDGLRQGFRRDQRGGNGGGADSSSRDYRLWLATDSGSLPDDAIAEAGPSFCLLLNAGGDDDDLLIATINSIADQSYPRWELFVVRPSSAIEPTPVLPRGVAALPRIHYIEQDPSRPTDSPLNALLAKATGSYLVPIDCGTILERGALAEFAGQLAKNRDAVLCYSDHDHMQGQGSYSDPYFKPDWNPLLLLTQNYISPLAAFTMPTREPERGWAPRHRGHLAWDLALQATAAATPRQIIHLTKILAHLRTTHATLHSDKSRAPQALEEMATTIASHLPRLGHAGVQIAVTAAGAIRLSPHLPEPCPKVSIIIPTRNSHDILQRCIDSILQQTNYLNFELVIVDNQSDDPGLERYFDSLAARPGVKLLAYDAPFNYSAINNFAVQHCNGEILCFLNNDIEVIAPDWLAELVCQAIHPQHGAVGAMLYYPDDRIQHGGIILGHSTNGPGGVAANAFWGLPRGFAGQGGRMKHVQYVSAVTGACLAVRRTIFEEVGGFDQNNLEVDYNDIDLCLRLGEKGYHTVFTPFAELYHHESVSRGRNSTDAKQARFSREVLYMHRRWGQALRHDPYFPSGDLGACQWQVKQRLQNTLSEEPLAK